jgi:hypothetical protein
MGENLIKGYLEQTEQYFSESKDAFLQVKEMHPRHAANAAVRYVKDAAIWADEAGVQNVTQPGRWMIQQPLFVALVMRANLWA